jgi:hypothetical protein
VSLIIDLGPQSSEIPGIEIARQSTGDQQATFITAACLSYWQLRNPFSYIRSIRASLAHFCSFSGGSFDHREYAFAQVDILRPVARAIDVAAVKLIVHIISSISNVSMAS